MAVNAGYAGGMNHGLRRHFGAAADVLLLTHDARLDPGSVKELVRSLRSDSRIGIVGPVLSVDSTDEIWSAGVRRDGGVLAHRRRADVGQPFCDADAIDGTVMLLRHAATAATNGFDERFFMYYEESDLCLRAQRLGWRVGVAPNAVARTEPGRAKRQAAHAYFLARNGLEYGRRAAGPRGMAQVLLALIGRTYLSLPRPWAGTVEPGQARVFRDRLVGTALGAVHFCLRRWGPPPAVILRLSDISGVQ
jgi:GT2 family glycosyltransferase